MTDFTPLIAIRSLVAWTLDGLLVLSVAAPYFAKGERDA